MANNRICSIPDCGKPSYVRGWCTAHHFRWKRHGDPLGGGTPRGSSSGSPMRYFHEVVLAYEGTDCLKWPFACDGQGSARLRHGGRLQAVARMVCEEHRGPPPTPEHEAAHSCGKGHEGCVAKRHLSWKTHEANMDDMWGHGTRICGERVKTAKLTEAAVREIRALRGNMSQREIAGRLGVTQQQVSRIQSGKRWAWLE